MGYEVVERRNIGALLREMKIEAGGLIDPAQAKTIAFAEQAEGMVFGSARTTLNGEIYFINLRFIDVATSEIVWSSHYKNTGSAKPRDSIVDISKSIQEQISMPITSSLDSHGRAAS